MYRIAARRFLASRIGIDGLSPLILRRVSRHCPPYCASTDFVFSSNHGVKEPPTQVDCDRGSRQNEHASSTGGGCRTHSPPRVEYKEEETRILRASLNHVPRLGWTEEAMMAGARDVGVSPSIVGAFQKKEAALVEFFMDECFQKLVNIIDSEEGLQSMASMDRISKLVRARLEMQVPYISKWPQALSIQANPSNVSTSFKQRAMLVDEIWHAIGDDKSDIDWYVKRTVLGGIYSTTEIYMLTDSSPEFRDTWTFLDERVKEAFDLRKTIQEASYLAEVVGIGMEKSFRGFVKRVFQ